ncbi:unnamed protein product [Closterium sp. NIES-53]
MPSFRTILPTGLLLPKRFRIEAFRPATRCIVGASFRSRDKRSRKSREIASREVAGKKEREVAASSSSGTRHAVRWHEILHFRFKPPQQVPVEVCGLCLLFPNWWSLPSLAVLRSFSHLSLALALLPATSLNSAACVKSLGLKQQWGAEVVQQASTAGSMSVALTPQASSGSRKQPHRQLSARSSMHPLLDPTSRPTLSLIPFFHQSAVTGGSTGYSPQPPLTAGKALGSVACFYCLHQWPSVCSSAISPFMHASPSPLLHPSLSLPFHAHPLTVLHPPLRSSLPSFHSPSPSPSSSPSNSHSPSPSLLQRTVPCCSAAVPRW